MHLNTLKISILQLLSERSTTLISFYDKQRVLRTYSKQVPRRNVNNNKRQKCQQ